MTDTATDRALHAALDKSPLTKSHWRIWALCAMGVFIDGFDLFIIAVAIPLIAQDLGASKWLLGLIGAAAPMGAILGAAVLGYVTDKIGRKAMYMFDLCIFIVFSALSLVAWDAYSLIAFRFLLGIGIGADYPISSAYIAEFMPAKLRGKMLAGAFSFQALGSVAGAVVGLLVLMAFPSEHCWRLMLGSGIIPALLVMAMRHSAPESPRWLLSKGRTSEAREVVAAVTERDDLVIESEPVASAEPVVSPDARTLLTPLFLKRTMLALLPWFLLDIALYAVGTFTPSLISAFGSFQSTHHPHGARAFIEKDMIATQGAIFLDVFLVIGFALSVFLVERVGRIKLQLFGFLGMTLGLGVLAWAGDLPKSDQSLVMVFVGFAIFNLLVNTGPNATTYLLASELFPTNLRATGHGLASAAGKVGAVIGIFFLPVAIATHGLSTTMAFVAGVGFLGFVVTWILGIETAGASLEDLSDTTKT